MSTSASNYTLICGMEVHAELKTKSKMFCGCKNDPFGAPEPNIYTCPVCLGMPGALPVANQTAIEWTIKLGLALNCKVNLFSKFDRKNYFYPDIPKAYQISQYDIPFCYGGYLDTSFGRIGITRIHLEEDTGKLKHSTIHDEKVSLVDFNRSSVPLVEIVTEPDIHSPEQAKEYGKKLRQIIRYLEIGDCDMEQGGMRLEANISLLKIPNSKLQNSITENELPNYKVEVKNINSFRFVEQAIKFEMNRHAEILKSGKTPVQETRGWNPVKSITFSQRTKEDAEDYRYFPDPDLPPIRFTQEQIDLIQASLPELPDQKVNRWETEYTVESRFGELLADNRPLAEFIETLFTEAKSQAIGINKLASLLVNKKIAFAVGQTTPQEILEHFHQLNQTDELNLDEVDLIINQVIVAHPQEVAAYKSGKTALLNFFVGQTMKQLKKKLDVGKIKAVIEEKLIQ